MEKHPKYWYRVTKYDTEKRDELGRYTDQTEWTDYDDKTDPNYTFKDYLLTEAAYIYAVHYFIELNKDVEYQLYARASKRCLPVKNSKILPMDNFLNLEDALRGVLRNEKHCNMRTKNMCVHFGWDYYMYIGSNTQADTNEIYFGGVKIYIEKITCSPYAKQKELL